GPGTTSPLMVRGHGPCLAQGVFQFHSWPVTRTVTMPAARRSWKEGGGGTARGRVAGRAALAHADRMRAGITRLRTASAAEFTPAERAGGPEGATQHPPTPRAASGAGSTPAGRAGRAGGATPHPPAP